jgi:hypothetical protein
LYNIFSRVETRLLPEDPGLLASFDAESTLADINLIFFSSFLFSSSFFFISDGSLALSRPMSFCSDTFVVASGVTAGVDSVASGFGTAVVLGNLKSLSLSRGISSCFASEGGSGRLAALAAALVALSQAMVAAAPSLVADSLSLLLPRHLRAEAICFMLTT